LQKLEADLAVKREQAQELESQAAILQERDPIRAEDIERRRAAVQERIQALEGPLAERRLALDRTRQVHQFLRDVEDELLWVEERQRLADDPNVGNSLQSVQTLQKKNQVHVAEQSPLRDRGAGIPAWRGRRCCN